MCLPHSIITNELGALCKMYPSVTLLIEHFLIHQVVLGGEERGYA